MPYYDQDQMGNYTGYVDQEAEALALREEEERKRKEEEERARKENDRLAKERDNLAVHKQEVTTYANGSKTITNVAEVPATANAPGRPTGPVAPSGFQGQTDEFGGVDEAVAKQVEMRKAEQARAQQEDQLRSQAQRDQAAGNQRMATQQGSDIWKKQLQVESGNQQTDQNGQIITSPKGALGRAQVMPRTAMQPGYGVPDIFTLAKQAGVSFTDRSEDSAKQLLANPDLNMQMGQNYKNGMLNHFGGDEEKATASYNAGAGRVNQAVQRAQQQGGSWKDYLPNETKNYLKKIFPQARANSPIAPSGQFMGGQPGYDEAGTPIQANGMPGNPVAQAFPVAPPGQFMGGQPGYDEAGTPIQANGMPGGAQPAPVAQPFMGGQPGYDEAGTPIQANGMPGGEQPAPVAQPALVDPNAYTGQGLRIPGMKPTGVESSAGAIDAYQASQNNPLELMKLGHSDDPAVPEWIKERSRNRAADLITETREMNKAKQIVGSSTETELAKYLRKKTEGGSYLKLFMYNMLGMDKSAAEESAKLGKGDEKLATTADGKPALVKYGINGTPIEGYDATTGKKLTAEQLAGSSPRAKLTGKEGKDESLATARTQASHAFTSTKGRLERQRDEFIVNGATPADLKSRGLDDTTIQTKAQASSDSVMSDAQRFITSRVKDVGLAATGPAPTSQTGQTSQTPSSSGKASVVETPEAQQTVTKEDDPYKDSKTLAGWDNFRDKESVSNKKRRTAVSADDIQRQAELLVTGDMEPKDITGLNAGNLRANAVARAKELDPTYSPVDAHLRVAAMKQWTKPDSPIGKTIAAHITAANSIDDVRDYFKALNNGNVKLANEIANRFNDLTGKPEFIQAKTGMMLLGPEIIKSIIMGGGGVTERKAAEELVNPNLSPKQWAAAFKTLEDFQGNALKSQEARWTAAKLPKDQFRERMLGGSPAAQELLDRATKHQADKAAMKAGLPSAPSQSDVEAEMRKRGLIK